MRFFFFISMLFISFLKADEPFESPDATAADGLPSTIIAGCVSAISGEYIESTQEMVVEGPEKLQWFRHYSHQSNPLFSYDERDRVDVKRFKDSVCAKLEKGCGSQYAFKLSNDPDYRSKEVVPLKLSVPKGMAIEASVGSGRTTPKNHKAFWYPSDKKVIIRNSKGEVSTYKRLKEEGKDGSLTFLQKEFLKQNGTFYSYFSSKKQGIQHQFIQTRNGKTKTLFGEISYSTVDLKDAMKKTTVIGSDGQELTYHWERKITRTDGDRKIKNFYLKKVEHSHRPTIHYAYNFETPSHHYAITQKSLPNHRFLKISYGSESESDNFNRVVFLRAPVGSTQDPVTTHTFSYKIYKKKGKKKNDDPIFNGGRTDVADALGYVTRYSYNADLQPTSIRRYNGPLKISHEKFVWESRSFPHVLSKTLLDGQKNIHHSKHFKYDRSGHMIAERLYGKLTGLPTGVVRLDSAGLPVSGSCERDEKRYAYSNDYLHLCVEETHSNGMKVLYQYVPDTEKMSAKFVWAEGQIRKREFYTYDENFILSSKIIDDGSSPHREDLTGVTERHLTEIQPIKTAPFSLPEKITESFLDFETGNYRQLKASLFSYSKEGKVLSETLYDANNQLLYTLKWTYDAHGNPLTETTPLGQMIQKKYDANNNLIYQRVSDSSYRSKNTYDYSNRLIKQEEIHDNGTRLVTTYQYDYLGRRVSTTDPYGHETRQVFDSFGRVIKIIRPTLLTDNGQAVSPVIQMKYNVAGYPIEVIDPKGHTTLTEYNIRGKPLKISHPDGSIEQFYYRLDGELIAQIDKSGVRTVWEKDYQGRITKETLYGINQEVLKETRSIYNAFHLLKTIDPLGEETCYTYDGAGRVKTITQGTKKTEQFYDSLGRVNEIREWFGESSSAYRSTIKTYDGLNRVIREHLMDADGNCYHHSKTTYDRRGNKIMVREGDQVTRTTYDTHNQPVTIVNPSGETTRTVYNTHFLNSIGQRVLQTTVTDPLGNQTIDTYDAANRLVETETLNPFGKQIFHQQMAYDLCGNRTRISNYLFGKNIDPKKIDTVFDYTPDNQVSLCIEDANCATQKITRYEYNAYRQKSATIKPNGVRLECSYDALGRLQTLSSSDQTVAYTFAYDLNNRLLSSLDLLTNTTIRRAYDAHGFLIQETLPNELSLSYKNDPLGRLTQVTLPDQTTIEYCYNAVDLKQVKWKNYIHTNQHYTINGKLLESTLPENAGTIKYTYNKKGKCTSITAPHYTTTVEKHDALGQLTHYQAQGIEYHFSYDERHQLQSEQGHATHSYLYDSLSNRIEKDEETSSYNTLCQLLFKGNERFAYDPNGNMTSRDNGAIRYTYDALDRLIAIEKEGENIRYCYDSFHRRYSRTMNGEEEKFIYQGDEDIGRVTNGTIDQLRILGSSGRAQTIAIELEGIPYLTIQDLAGNIAQLLDIEGKVVEEYRYTAFGEKETLNSQLTVENPWTYSNKRWDKESNLVFFGLRYYAPDLGRWITADPSGFGDGPNLYAYLHNNPFKYYDPFGLFSIMESLYSGFGSICSAAHRFFGGFFNSTPHYNPTEERIATTYETIGDRHHAASVINERSGTYDLNTGFINPETNQPFNLKESKDVGMGFFNGIMNRFEDFSQSVCYLGKMSEYNFSAIHSASYGIAQDLICYFKALVGYSSYQTEQQLHAMWDKFFLEASPDAIFLQIAHSRGCVYVRNALMNYPPHLRERIDVLAIAPGAYIDSHLCHKVTHYVSKRDIVPWVDAPGRARCSKTVIVLDPHPNANWFLDHGINSPTYEGPITETIRNHYQSQKK